MTNKNLFKSILVVCLIAFTSVAAFISCEVGLGEAVDVAAPVITIDTPKTSAIIRDTFAITGTWSDDGSIKSVEVELRNTGTDKTYSNFEPVLTMVPDTKEYKGDWYVSIDPVTAKVPDGSYEAIVTITDNGKHSTEITRTFIIDNTSPVMVLSRPSSSKTDSDNLVESYGQYLTLEGQAADDNDIEKIVINFYSKDAPETLLWTKEITSVPPTISLDVAKFLDKDVYTKIYGDEKAGEKYYYCTITAYDSAKRYPLAGQEKTDDELGNAESSYILWADWEKFQSDYQKASGGNTKLKVPDLYAIKAGTSASSTRSATETSLIEGLFEKAIPCGSFKLNPENSPTFSVSGLELGLSTDVENERALTVQLAKGLDGLSLVTDDMKVYLIPVTSDASGKEVLGEKLYPQNSEFQKKGDGQFLTKILKDDCKNAEGTAVSLEYGKTYIIGVDGEDIEGNKIVPGFDGKQYYIKFKAKNVAPGLTIVTPSPATTYLKKGQTLTFSGSTSVPDGHPTITITCKKGEATTATQIYKYQVTDADKDKIEGGLIFYNFEFTVPVDGNNFKFDQANSNSYVFDVTTDLEDMPTTRTKTVIYDIDGPTISIDSILPTAEKFKGTEDGAKEEGEYLNGDVTMKVAILDDYDAVQTTLETGKEDRRPYFIIADAQTDEEIAFRVGTETVPTVKHLITTPAKQSFVIHTEDIASGTDSRKIKVKIFAQDRAGNLGVDIENLTNTSFEREYTVDQTTDIPVILPSNADSLTLTYATEQSIMDALASKVYKSVLTTGSDLILSLKDDDGIAVCNFTLSEKDKSIADSSASEIKKIDQTLQDKPSDYNFRYTLPTISGRYECKLVVTDTTGKAQSKDFWIVVTGAAPQVTIDSTNPDNKIITLSSGQKEDGAKVKFVNTVAIESGYNEFLVKRLETVNGSEVSTVLYGENGTKGTSLTAHTFTDEFTPAANRSENKIKYVVTDEMGHIGEREFTYYIDNVAPIITPASISVPSNSQTESVSFRFAATSNDKPNGDSDNDVNAGIKSSGVSKIQYTFDPTKADAHIKTVTGVSSINETVIFKETEYSYAFASEGNKKIFIRAIDDVGNIGDWVEKEFMYDTAAPALNIASYKRGSENAVNFAENAASKSFETGEAFTLSGTVSDNTGIQTFEIWQNDKKLNVTSAIISNGLWTISGLPKNPGNLNETLVDSGTYVYTVKATDNSAFGADSAKTTEATVTVKIDKTKPTVTIDLATNGNDSAAYGENSLKGSAYTFRGEAKDDPANTGDFSSGFDTLYYAFTKTETEPSTYSLFVKPTTSSWSIPMNLGTGSSSADTDDTLYEGKKYLWVKGVDKAGNWSEVKHVAFMIDQADPVVTCAVYKNTDTSATAADTDGIVYLNKATGATKYTLKGTVSDANGISKLTVDGTEVTLSGTNWSKEFNVQGNFVHEIVVYDTSGKTAATSKSKTITSAVMFDTTDPTATVTDFDTTATAKAKWLSGTGDTYINGTASDVGAGLDKLEIKVDSDTYATIPLSTNWSYKYSIPNGFEENDDSTYHSVTVKATDKAKNSKEYIYYFRYDKTPPSANLSLNRNGEFVKAADFTTGVTLSGNANDGSSRAVKSAIISVKKDGAAHSTIDVISSLSSDAASFGDFTKNLTASDYADGLYLFTLEVKDEADNSPASTPTASMTVDKTVPVINKVRFGELSSSATSLSSNSSKSKISVQFTEKNPEAVYYYINDGSNPNLTGVTDEAKAAQVSDADWINMKYTASGTTCTASKDISFNDGKGKVYIKVVDKAENVTYDTTLTYEVDTKAPDVCTLLTVDEVALNGSKLINGSNAVTFTVNATDYNDNLGKNDPTRVASVQLTKIGNDDTYTGDEIVSGTAKLSDGTKTGVWTITIPIAKFSGKTTGSYTVTVTVKDTLGNARDYQLFTLDIDQVKPTLNSYILESSYDAGVKDSIQTFYMNNSKTSFTLTGVAKDDREIEEVKLSIKNTSGTVVKELTSSDSAWTFTSGDWAAAWAGWTNYVTVELSVKDKAQNTVAAPVSFKIIFDTTAPVGLHAFDTSSKDIYFRVGDQNNDDISPSSTNPVWDNNLDKDVGGKYKPGTFGNKETIRIRGNFMENGSGVKMIYYKLYASTPTTDEINTFKAAPSANADGYFAPKDSTETTRRVFYNGTIASITADGTANGKNYKLIASTYLTTISGFQEGNNYLVLVAEDNVGNTDVDTVSDGVNYYTINVDTLPPEITALTQEKYSNKTEDLNLSFAVEDKINKAGIEPAGIKKVTVNIQGVANANNNKVATFNQSTREYEVTFPKAQLPGTANSTGSYSISVTAVDNAGTGNSDTRSIGNLVVDLKAPVVEIGNISDADNSTAEVDVNGTVTISGIASDETKLNTVSVAYKKQSDSDTAENWKSLSVTGTNNWSASFNTKASGVADNTVYTIRAVATDSAGNSKTITTDIKVNQNSDRPVVKFTNLVKENDSYILKYGNNAQLEGTITDDDATSNAVVKTFIASSTEITSSTGATGTTEFNAKTGDYKFTPPSTEDGAKKVYFYIVDNKDNVFYTTRTVELSRPYQQYKTDDKEDNNTALSYNSDSNAPTINSVELQAWKNAAGITDEDKNGAASALGSSCIVGGSTKNYVDLTVSAKDGNGIKGLVIELSQNTVTKRYRSNAKVGMGEFADSGTVSVTSDINSNHVYTIPRINLESAGFTQNKNSDIDDIKNGVVKVRVYVYDNSGLYSNQESQFVIDNTAPVLNITAPKTDGEIVYAIQSNTVGGNVEATDVEKIEYTVTLSNTQPASGWNEVTNARLSASLIFDNDVTSTENGFHSKTLREWLKALKGQTDEEMNNGGDERENMYVHFKVIDECGNAGYSCRQLSVYPNGDKPSIDLVYPEDKADGSAPSLAGTIRVYGYASVAIGTITGTYIQIDPSYDGTFNEGWEAELSSLISGKASYDVVDIGTTGIRGIKATGTQNWNLPINGNSEFNPDGNESRKMAIRIYAESDSRKISEPFIQLFDVDPNAPHIGGDGTKDNLTDEAARQYSLQIVDFDDAAAAQTITNYKNPVSYKTEMWVKGQKYLIASVYDDSGIKTLTLNENISGVGKVNLVTGGAANINAKTYGGASITVTESTCGYTGKKNFNIVIPLPTNSGSGSVNYQLEATEDSGNNNSCTETIKVNYDNTAPRLAMTTHAKYSIDADIHQSNGFYTLKGYATDAEGSSNVSGIRGIAFYFLRRGSANTRVYDPMLQNNSVAVRTGSSDSDDITYSHGLYWKEKNITRDPANLKKLTLTAEDANIHVGGLAMLGGNIYRIESVSGTEVILEDEVPVTQTTASFALALVVDNLTKKETTTNRTINKSDGTYGYGYYSANDTADDGDLMVEDWDGTSIEGQWTAIINSANIPDGPIELHYVAFDKSQNYAIGVVGNVSKETYNTYATKDVTANKAITDAETDSANNLVSKYYYYYDSSKPAYISNNAPRIAGVTVGTDYNGNGTIEDTEKKTAYYKTGTVVINDVASTKITDVTKKFIASSNQTPAGAAMMVVKDKTDVELEIIGGNGNLYYQWNIDSEYKEHSDINSFTQNNTAISLARTDDEGLTENDFYITSKLPAINFTAEQLLAAVGGANGTNGVRWWTIEIWDSTEETSKFSTSQYAELKLPLDVQILDTLAPNTVISPLYWKSSSDNSVYRDINGKLYGHVELKSDIGTSELGTTYGKDDDKVSGVVVFKGFAYDNKRLANLKWAIIDHVEGNTYTSPVYLFPATGSALQNGASFANGIWTGSGSLNINHYKFEVSDTDDGTYLDERGHRVAWTLTVDTSYIKNVVEQDARIYVYAQDAAGRTTTITNTATTYDLADNVASVPTYQVDILPYITRVTTRMSKKDTTNPEVYSRTAKGHYPIASDETATGSVILHGYNLAAANADVDISSGMGSRASGAYAYTVSGTITTINNMNNNDAHGEYDLTTEGLAERTKVANMYNRQPNTSTNLTLTDDVYFDMWEFNSDSATSGSALRYPVMHINPTNNQIGFGFVRGSDSVSFPANGNSYIWYQTNRKDYIGTNFVYDSNGVAHNVSIGLDAQFDTGIAGRMLYNNSNWYAGNNGANRIKQWDMRYSISLESIGIPNGVYVKGVNTNVDGGMGIIDIDRFSTPAIAASAHTNGTAVYIMYYDSDHDQIRFRYGEVPETGANRTGTQYGLLNDSKSEVYRHNERNNRTDILSDTSDKNNTYNTHGMFEAHKDYYALVTGKYYNQANDNLGGTAGTLRTDTGNNGSAYYALGVVPGDSMNNDKVVMIWFDQVANKLMYMYRMNLGTNTTASNQDASVNGVTNVWSKPEELYSGPLQDCAMTVDVNGGIHIAAYDQNNANLLYMYKKTYDTAGVVSCVVDAYSQIGNRLSIDAALNADNKVVPYISYFAEGLSSLPKLAYLPDGITTTSADTIAASIKDGAEASTNLFTRDWEVSMIPTSSKLQSGAGYNVSIGVFKDKATGKVGQAFKPAKTTDVVTDQNTRKRYANGTTELVLGYGIKNNGVGYVETAMRK